MLIEMGLNQPFFLFGLDNVEASCFNPGKLGNLVEKN